jgi:hypothetical protein
MTTRNNILYSAKYEAYYDEVKDIWLENVCGDPTCGWCNDRPDKPSESADLDTGRHPDGTWHQ